MENQSIINEDTAIQRVIRFMASKVEFSGGTGGVASVTAQGWFCFITKIISSVPDPITGHSDNISVLPLGNSSSDVTFTLTDNILKEMGYDVKISKLTSSGVEDLINALIKKHADAMPTMPKPTVLSRMKPVPPSERSLQNQKNLALEHT